VTLRPAVIAERLRKLREVLTNLRELKSVPKDEFVRSYQHHWLAERGLQLAAEVIFDIGNHVLAARFNDHPSDYEDVLERLAAHQVISPELREKLRGLGGFRNVLVHAYLDIDRERVYAAIQQELDGFGGFALEIEDFIAG
jgi:uncharacterized protein YutE (UPF0331/DUF86 family)